MLSKRSLEPDTRKMLMDILAKSTEDLDKDEKAFLVARRDYLTIKEKELYGLGVVKAPESGKTFFKKSKK